MKYTYFACLILLLTSSLMGQIKVLTEIKEIRIAGDFAVATSTLAKRLAIEEYTRKSLLGVDALDSVKRIYLVKPEFAIDGFSKVKQSIWAVEIAKINSETKALAYVHPESSKVIFVKAPWLEQKTDT